MLNQVAKKIIQNKAKVQSLPMQSLAARAFSHGPYNPLNYKHLTMPEELPT
jgi:hypothetical protein